MLLIATRPSIGLIEQGDIEGDGASNCGREPGRGTAARVRKKVFL
jgi:hypothetical protein